MSIMRFPLSIKLYEVTHVITHKGVHIGVHVCNRTQLTWFVITITQFEILHSIHKVIKHLTVRPTIHLLPLAINFASIFIRYGQLLIDNTHSVHLSIMMKFIVIQ